MIDFSHLVPKGQVLTPPQTCGIATLVLERRAILGDEVGVGKTAQALLAIEATKSYPVLIACPASLRANWEKECVRWLPDRSVHVGNGVAHISADITIVSYSSLHKWAAIAFPFKAFVCDESHYLSNPGRRRTKAALQISYRLPENGLVFALTGTPLVNKPEELIGQLKLIGRYSVFAQPNWPNDERSWRKSFLDYWCKDSQRLRYLNRALRQTCYIRRNRQTAIGRRPTLRFPIYTSLALSEYGEAESALESYLIERNGLQGASSAMRAKGLAMLSTLYRLVGEAKVWAAREWIDSYLDTNPDRSLVVFAAHKEVQRALVAHYDCPHILGSEKQVEDQKKRFANKQSRLIVCSLGAASEGHTLTTAYDVLFVEMPWSLGKFIQAEARINRLGQKNPDTYSYIMVGAGTIDERIWNILQDKQSLFNAAVEGQEGVDNAAMARQIFSYYTQKGQAA